MWCCFATNYRTERRKYYHHREKSRSEPQKYLAIIIDGMDQNKTNIPNQTRKPKSTQNLWHLRTHLTGGLAHTRAPNGKHAFAFYDLLQWAHNCNLTIHVLLSILVELQRLPGTLYLQLDNCSRENKNKYFLAFCALMVQLRIFKKVSV